MLFSDVQPAPRCCVCRCASTCRCTRPATGATGPCTCSPWSSWWSATRSPVPRSCSWRWPPPVTACRGSSVPCRRLRRRRPPPTRPRITAKYDRRRPRPIHGCCAQGPVAAEHCTVLRWLQLLFDFDSMPVRRPFDCLSKVIKVTVT